MWRIFGGEEEDTKAKYMKVRTATHRGFTDSCNDC